MSAVIVITCAYCKTVKKARASQYHKKKRYCNSTCYNRATKKFKPRGKLWTRNTFEDRNDFIRFNQDW